jgi:transcriptional regulator with XRE-family HTH domain
MRNNIDFFRKKAGLSVQQVADQLGVTRGHIQKMKAGDSPISTRHLEKLAEILHCNPTDILSDNIQNEKGAGLDEKLLTDCYDILEEQAKTLGKRPGTGKMIRLSIKLYKIAEEDRKAGSNVISVGAARSLLLDEGKMDE